MTRRPLIHLDRRRRRLWIAGQRCHHGATGVAFGVAAAATLALRRSASARRVTTLMAVTGSALMAHDWHDRRVWFVRGWQSAGDPHANPSPTR